MENGSPKSVRDASRDDFVNRTRQTIDQIEDKFDRAGSALRSPTTGSKEVDRLRDALGGAGKCVSDGLYADRPASGAASGRAVPVLEAWDEVTKNAAIDWARGQEIKREMYVLDRQLERRGFDPLTPDEKSSGTMRAPMYSGTLASVAAREL